MTRGYSLRRRLVWLLTGTLAAIWLASALAAYHKAHRAADELLDAQLIQVADTLLMIVAGGEIEHFVEELHEHVRPVAVPIAFEVWHGDDGPMRRLVTSGDHGGFASRVAVGFSEGRHADAHWRFYAVEDDDGEYRVIVGQAHAARQILAREMSMSLLLPALLALPLMALAVWVGVGRAVRPVERLAQQVGTLDPQALRPVDEARVLPNEIAPLRAALNALVHRVNVAFDNERRFTADAAHELRTPLAALKVQAQVALRAQAGDAQRHALLQVIAGVDRMAHLVEQLLTLARVDPERSGDVALIDPRKVIEAVCADFVAQTEQNGQRLHAESDGGCMIAASGDWLRIALRNLVDNAVRYAGEGARIEVHLAQDGAGCSLTVTDDGPGVPPALRGKLSGRFVRGEVDEEGCGLGLSIVSRVAALLHAELAFGDGLPRADGGRGFAATLRFPRGAA